MSNQPTSAVPDGSNRTGDPRGAEVRNAEAGAPGLEMPTRGDLAKVFVAMGISSGLFFGIFWSLWMSVWRDHDLLRIVLGPGARGGVFFGVFMAILMRPATVTLTIVAVEALLRRLYAEAAKLRYRTLGQVAGVRVFGPRTLIRPGAFRIGVRVGDGRATIAGPCVNIKALKKRLEK